jgi:hypothetical protein
MATRPNRIILVYWKDGRENPYQAYSNLKLLFDKNPDLSKVYNYKTIANKFSSQEGKPYETEFIRIERLVVNNS